MSGREKPKTEFDEDFEAPSKGKRGRWISLAIGLVVVAVVAFAVLNGGASDANGAESKETETEEAKAAVPVEVQQITAGDVASYVTATANLVAENDVSVLAESEGRVTHLQVDEGHSVQRGQVLARLDSSDEQIALKKAELRHANAKLVFERGQDLFAKELISREEHDQLTVDFQIASQELAESEWALAQTVIRAPFGGRVTAREVQLGQHLAIGDSLFQITDFDPLIARIYLSESDIVGLKVGTRTRIQLNASPDIAIAGRVRQISPVVDTATGTVKVTVEAVDPPRDLRPGSFVSIHVVRETHHAALLVPRGAVLRELQSSHVFVADGDTAQKRAVTLGLEEDGQVEVLDGVTLGERVIVAGQGGLKEGATIRVLGEEPATTPDTETDSAITAG